MQLLFDIGGTNTRLALSHDGETLEKLEIFSTPRDFNDILAKLETLVVRESEKVTVIAGGIAGTFNQDKSALIAATNLTSLVGLPIKKLLIDKFKCPVYLENDAALAGLGEANKGAGRDQNIVAYLTISTGVGGVKIVDGKIDENNFGFEPGHQIINWQDNQKWDDLVSGAAIKRSRGEGAENIDGQEFWDDLADKVTLGLYNMVLFWSPEAIVLGGGMFKSPGLDLKRVEIGLHNRLDFLTKKPPVLLAALGDRSALEGALVYLQERF